MIAQIRELTIQYGKRTAVDALDVELAAGEIALLLGPNGAGKSTTLAAMAGVLLPTKGTIIVEGGDVAAARGKVGFADQPPQLYDFFTVDVSFVAARTMLRSLAFRLRDGAEGVVLVKPQFELSDKQLKELHIKVID